MKYSAGRVADDALAEGSLEKVNDASSKLMPNVSDRIPVLSVGYVACYY